MANETKNPPIGNDWAGFSRAFGLISTVRLQKIRWRPESFKIPKQQFLKVILSEAT
ncbi:hypothetical protein TRICHSKD4_3770 [Roseibium sp. TrichSKD4]|nr:hypothetical protein TRICHSKD4_3770 [Roseibium sp. TrichSKD4]